MFDYSSAIARCNDNSIKVILKKIEYYKEYSILCSATGVEYKNFRDMYPDAPNAINTWYKFANGGLLFDTYLLSTKAIIEELGGVRLSLNAYNNIICRKALEIPENLVVFAVASFGDVYCFDKNGSNEIYQWSVIEHNLVTKWANFSLWLYQEVNGAIELITDEDMYPIYNNQDGD